MARTATGVDGAVFQAADRLAEALQHSPEWEEWAAANAALERDDEVATLRALVRELSAQWQLARSTGGALSEDNRLADLQRTLQEHPAVVQQEASRLLVVLFLG